MKDYTSFSVTDFVMDDYFQTWVLTPDENNGAFWSDWIDEHPQKLKDIEEARTLLRRLNFTENKVSEETVAILWSRIKEGTQAPSYNKEPILSSTGKSSWYKAAVAAFLIVGTVTFFWFSRVTTIEYQTAFGETRTVVLPDSSTVILNSNSTLKLSSNWKDKPTREVWLNGEAFFSVVHKVNHQPFKVRTNEGVAIEVLGTTFNVYHRTTNTKIVLNTGKIRLSLPALKANEKILMKPGDLVEYKSKKYNKRTVDPKIYTAWTERNILLNHTRLRDMIQMMKDNYGIEVDVREELLDQTVSGSMPVTDAEGLIQQVAKAFRLKVIRKENRIELRE